ncbi:MAG: hypothetical protein KGO22_17085 [Gammaproteobacteria bacterium]|nr:hypothetical protein [Gammaproteobacteria bacterium]
MPAEDSRCRFRSGSVHGCDHRRRHPAGTRQHRRGGSVCRGDPARIVVDSRAQCIDHGEAGWAVRAGLVAPDSLIELGVLLAAPAVFGAQETVVADLTGVAIQDFEIAKSVWKRLPAE